MTFKTPYGEIMEMKTFIENFSKNYGFLLDSLDKVPGYRLLVRAGEEYTRAFPEFMKEFGKARQDACTSDRELAALALTLDEIGAEY